MLPPPFYLPHSSDINAPSAHLFPPAIQTPPAHCHRPPLPFATPTLLRSFTRSIRLCVMWPRLTPSPYTLFKGKAALSADPLLPMFSKLESGDYRVERRGVIMLTFWPAIGERKYDWDKRQKFALSATEVGTLIAWDSNDSCESFHDPSMLSSNAGQVRKSFLIKAHSGGTGYFFNLNVVNNVLKTNDRFTVPVTLAEFAVMRIAFTMKIPGHMSHGQNLLSLGQVLMLVCMIMHGFASLHPYLFLSCGRSLQPLFPLQSNSGSQGSVMMERMMLVKAFLITISG
ncbi:hypothetical protein ACS0TY_031347 [Phlomoides rotata]